MESQSSSVQEPVKLVGDPYVKQDVTDATINQLKKKRPNTDDLFAKAQSMGVDPFEILLHIADGNRMALDLDDEDGNGKPIGPELRAAAAREVLKYMYPTMKSAEVSGPNGTPLDMAVKVVFEGSSDDNQQDDIIPNDGNDNADC